VLEVSFREGLVIRFLTALCMLVLVLPACSGKSETPDVVVMNIAKSLDAGHPEAAWDAFPPSYQTDIDSVRILFASRMDKELYDRGFQVFGKLVSVLKTKKDFILAHPMAAGMMQQAEPQTYDAMVTALESFAKSDLSTLDGVSRLNIRTFLASSGGDLSRQIISLSKLNAGDKPKIEKLSDIQVTVVKSEKDRATLAIKAGEETDEQEWVMVEGRWIPEEMAQGWKPGVADVKKKLAELTITPEQKTQGLMIMGMAETAMDQILKTTTQEEFNQVLQGVLGPMMGGMMGGAMDGGMDAPAETPSDTE